MQIYRNWHHGLDCYVKFARDPHRYLYELVMPPISTTADYAEDDPYPAPCQYYMATGMAYKRCYTEEEWTALGTAMPAGAPATAMAVDAPYFLSMSRPL